MSWGNTLNLATRYMQPLKRPDLEIVSVMGGLTKGSDLNSFEITRRLADLCGAEHSYFTAPLYAGSAESRETLIRQDVFKAVIDKIRRADALAMAAGDMSDRSLLVRDGLPGDVDRADLAAGGAVGDVLGYILRADGSLVDHEMNERVIGIELEDLRSIPNVILGGWRHLQGADLEGGVGPRPRQHLRHRRSDREPPAVRRRQRAMTVFAGIDVGTSGVKVALFDEAERTCATAAQRLEVSRPHPGWSEQHPEAWWAAVGDCFDELAAAQAPLMARLAGIGLSGQMLGAVLLDRDDVPVRPAILWNDQRATAESARLLALVPDIGLRANGAPDPGLTAPKLLWLAQHEPAVIERARLLLLPKDYVRLRLTGETASEPTDAGGTMLLDCASGRWDPALCAAAGWPLDRLPALVEPWAEAGRLRAELAERWGTPRGVPVAAGAGDNMACTIGVGAARPGQAVITVGTSGVVCGVDGAFHPAPEQAVLTSAHAAPDVFLSMGVVMSATATLDWLASLTGTTAAGLAREAEVFAGSNRVGQAPVMRPSLSGLRTPHNRPEAAGALSGLTLSTDRAALGYAVMEGVAFQVRECVAAQGGAGVVFREVALVGGGARSRLWASMIATAIDRQLRLPEGAELAANLGAARLGRVAASAVPPLEVLAQPRPVSDTVQPDASMRRRLADRFEAYRSIPID